MSTQPWRITNLVLAVWLVASAFMWDHAPAQFHNAWMTGTAAAFIAAVAALYRPLRALNSWLAVWLVGSVWLLPLSNRATLLNSLILGTVMFIVSLLTVRAAAPAQSGHAS